MKHQFTTEEVERARKKLKYNKNLDIHEIRSEHQRYGLPEELVEIIKQILNETAKTGAYPEKMKFGMLTPLKIRGKRRSTFQLKTYNPSFNSRKDSRNNKDHKNNRKRPTIYTQDPTSISI